MNTVDRILTGVMTTILAASGAWAWHVTHPDINTGQLRFEDTVTVQRDGLDAEAMIGILSYGVPIEFVEDDAMVTFVGGVTESKYVDGFGWAHVQATAQITEIEDGWIRGCKITLSTNAPNLTASGWSTVRVHEFGHCLGLDHEEHSESIMAHSMQDDNFSPLVTEWDRKMISYRYFTE